MAFWSLDLGLIVLQLELQSHKGWIGNAFSVDAWMTIHLGLGGWLSGVLDLRREMR
jgi:hypothetical protein